MSDPFDNLIQQAESDERLSIGHLKILRKLIREHRGRDNAVIMRKIKAWLQQFGYLDPTLKDSRVPRQWIHELRLWGFPICSQGGVGYWFPENRAELEEAIEIEIGSKARTLLHMRSTMKKAGKRIFEQELPLFASVKPRDPEWDPRLTVNSGSSMSGARPPRAYWIHVERKDLEFAHLRILQQTRCHVQIIARDPGGDRDRAFIARITKIEPTAESSAVRLETISPWIEPILENPL